MQSPLTRRMATSLLALTVLPLLGSPAAAAPVEGDVQGLELLQAAQATNRALFARGEMVVEISDALSKQSATARIIWDGARTYRDYAYTDVIQERRGPRMHTRRARMIELPGVLLWYSPKARLAQKRVSRRQGSGYPKLLELRPDQAWFRMEAMVGSDKSRWETLLDPQAAPETVTKFVVKKEGDRVIVDRHYWSGNILRITASLAQGGNVVSYERLLEGEVTPETAWGQGTCVWDLDSRGNWYLKSYLWQRSNTADPDKLDFDVTMQVKEFNPDPVIPRDRFEFESLDFAPGTTVEDKIGKGRTYRIGQATLVGQDLLDALAEEMKQRGFAAPQREER